MKYSKQRDLVMKYIQLSDEHPTADMIYSFVKNEIPNISLGTVYRNLNQLCDTGMIRKIKMTTGSDRYDKTIINHCHMYCTQCNKVIDVPNDIVMDINNLIEMKTGHIIEYNNIVLTGICHICTQKNKGGI